MLVATETGHDFSEPKFKFASLTTTQENRVETAAAGTGEVAGRYPISPAAFGGAAGALAASGAGASPTGVIIAAVAMGMLTEGVVMGLEVGGKVVADWVKKDPERAGKAAEEAVKKEYNEF